jgi:glycosidase
LADAGFHQVYPHSFQDSNGDGIGDLPGLISRLEYIRDLGCTAIWMNPFFVSPMRDAGYDVADFCAVDPRSGTLADAKRLFTKAHALGLRVVLDLVAGHTSDQHPWFTASAKDANGKHRDWNVWTRQWLDCPAGMVGGMTPRNGAYLPNFFAQQPALNSDFAKPDPSKPWQLPMSQPGPKAGREALRKAMAFWLDLGCDGFRTR